MKSQISFYRTKVPWKKIVFIFNLIVINNFLYSQGQLPECTSTVPFFNIDLSASPDATFTTPEIIRKTGCCSVNNEYVSFYVKLHPDVAQFELIVAPGYADPGGAGNYNIISGGDLTNPGACGTQIPGGGPICITGPGPHKIVYSKPGSNKIKYIFRQIPKPIYPISQPARVGCSLPLPIYGLNGIAITAIAKSSNLSASLTTCNTFMSCLNCDNPVFQPGTNATYPYTITYQVTGTPKAAFCGVFPSSGTFTITVYDELNISATPNPASFCSGGTGINLTASATGGFGTYNYYWFNSSGDTVSTSASYFATSAGTYTAQVKDGLVTATCAPKFITVPVVISSPPTVNAGTDKWVCATNPIVYLNGTSSTGSGVWSNGTGTFNPNTNSLVTTYTASNSEINAGFADLILTSSGTGAGCANSKDTIRINFSDSLDIQLQANPISCYNGTTTINSNVSGGSLPLTYSWSNGTNGISISASSGTYSLIITDSKGCTASSGVFLPQPNPILLNTSTTLDFGTCDGTATVSVSGGTIPFNISWSNGNTGATSTNLCYGIDTVGVTDANGCFASQSVVINNPTCSGFDVFIDSLSNVSCYGGGDGYASADVLGGVGSIAYSWNSTPPQNTSNASGLPSGNYVVTATDANGCMDIVSVNILQPTVLTNTMTNTNASGIGITDGTATANPQGGTPSYSYSWTPSGQTNQTAIGLSGVPGNNIYHVAITDDNNCIKNDSVIINQPPCDNFLIGINTENVSCNGLADGSAFIVVADGTPPYSISWSNGINNSLSINGLTAGNYSVTVTDASLCSTFQTFTITQPNPLQIGLVPTNISCNGSNNGTIDLTVTGGTYPYSYSWNLGITPYANHEDLVNLSPGTYTVTVTDLNNCSTFGSIGITQPNKLSSSYTYQDNPCFKNSLGSINMTPAGGSQPYNYNWTGPNSYVNTTQDINGLVSGLYQYTIIDNNNCVSGPISVYINEPDSLVVSATMTQQVSCLGTSNGAAISTVSGGNTGFTYLWTGPSSFNSSSQNISNIAAGTYQVTVTDNKNCTAQDQVTITTIVDITPPIISCVGNQIESTSSTSCAYTKTTNSWNATATDNCTIASLIYQLTGATAGTGSTLNNVTFNQGITQVLWIATDGLGNSDSCSYTVTIQDTWQPGISSCGVQGTDTVSCDLGSCSYTQIGNNWNPTVTDNCSISSVSYTLSGATTGSGNSLNNVVFNLGTTIVNWLVIDASGNQQNCSYTIVVEDNQDPIIVGCPSNFNIASEPGLCGATVTWQVPNVNDNCGASLSGNYNPGQFFNVGQHTITYLALDASGNNFTCSFSITVLDNEIPALTLPNDISSCNSFIEYPNPSGADNCGVQSIIQLSGLPSGSSFPIGTTVNVFQITDINGNTSTGSFSVNVRPVPTASIQAIDISCYGLNNGSLNLTVNGGTQPYIFDWSNGANSEDINNLSPGNYGVQITDFYGCETTANASITQPETIIISGLSQNVSCYSGINGSLDVSVSGGVQPYSYLWNNGQQTQDINTLVAGSYALVVTDNNGCTAGWIKEITQPQPLTIQGTVADATCTASNGTIRTIVTGGTPPYSYSWSNGTSGMNAIGLEAGTYTLTVEDNNNCQLQYTGIVGSNDNLLSELSVKDARCYGEASGMAQVFVATGNPPYTYEWSTGEGDATAEDLAAGAYSVLITDMFGCTSFYNFAINQPDSFYVVINASDYVNGYNLSGNQSEDGWLAAIAFGGTEPYAYLWSTGDTTLTISGLSSGIYTIIVEDNNGCVVNGSYRLSEPGVLEMPTGYSPNGDLRNDVFLIHGLDAYPENKLIIYNRWGNIVYEQSNYNNDWNGENNSGEEIPDGTYFALLTVYGKEEITLKGYVDLRRK